VLFRVVLVLADSILSFASLLVGSVYLAICSSNTPVSLWLLLNGLYNILLLTSFCLVLPLLLCCGLQGQSHNIGTYIFRSSGTVSQYWYLYL
jgi:hypothetical protein